jgi:fructan beta-fructosidase
MRLKVKTFLIAAGAMFAQITQAQTPTTNPYRDQYRPQEHFSPQLHWMNDPNGMVYFDNTYHLFFQYYPGGTTWGPMHWGHAVSTDLVHWKELPIALYPDSLGYIFSGSAVVDSNNTSGFGKNGKIPLVAIFTHHDPKGEKAGTANFQNESLAYSLDNGSTWTKYSGNPVLKNPGIRDFRDPKVRWYPTEKKWVMTLATKDHITFYSAPDLKNWTKESEFGNGIGAHGGVWECPDLFPLKVDGKTWWVLIVNVNPGGPNGGSATQYFIGQFDGNEFKPSDDKTRWLDYGPDEYAGITWGNTGSRAIFLGWMSNWVYANQVPTKNWRNAMTVPRELALKQVNGELLLTSEPVKEIMSIEEKPALVSDDLLAGKLVKNLSSRYVLKFGIDRVADYAITLSNAVGDSLVVGYDKADNRYYINRAGSGKVDFNADFAKPAYAPRLSTATTSELKVVVDDASIEIFADDGLTVMTSVFFPKEPFNQLRLKKSAGVTIKGLTLMPLKSIW